MARGNAATQNRIPSNSTSRRVSYHYNKPSSFDLERHIIFGQAVILSLNKHCYSEGLSSNKAFIYVDSTHLCTNSTDLSDPARDQANLASLL